MARELVFLIIIIIFNSILAFDNDLNSTYSENDVNYHKIKGNGEKVLAMYGQFDRCEGYFSRIQWDVIDQRCEWKCDSAWAHPISTSANGYRDNVRTCIDANSTQFVKDSKGQELYNSMGIITESKCMGDQLIVQSELHITRGRCKCDTGVTELMSKRYSALIAVKGVCETICYGTVWSHYWPGKQ